MNTQDKVQALLQFLVIDESDRMDHWSDVDQCSYDSDQFSIDGGEYLVLDDSEADERTKEQILESLWAFNYHFLCAHSDVIAAMPEEAYDEMTNQLCENANDFVKAAIKDIDHFVNYAISADGRGHFLSGYDGAENEEIVNGQYYYIYRIN